MARDPVDRVLEHNLNTERPYDPILNPRPNAVAPPPTLYNPHETDDDFKPATGDGR